MVTKCFTNVRAKGPSSLDSWCNLQMGLKTNFVEPIQTWSKSQIDKFPSAQFLSIKTLKNGNEQKRIVTALNDGTLCIETNVVSPSGELLKAYSGIRNGYTIDYQSGNDKASIDRVVGRIVRQDKKAYNLTSLEKEFPN